MNVKSTKTYGMDVVRVTIGSFVLNIILTVIKLLVGFVFGSFSLISDGFHSLTDLVTDVVVVLGVKMGSNPPDEDHHYGHGKFETFAEMVVSLFIMGTGLSIIYVTIQEIFGLNSSSVLEFVEQKPVIIVSIVSIVIKEFLYRWTLRLSVKWKSSLLKTNAWHHRSDSISSFVVLLGMILMFFGFEQADVFGGFVVGCIIFITGIKFSKKVIQEFLEAAPNKDVRTSIQKVLDTFSVIHNYHNIRVRKMGSRLFMDMHIMLEPTMNLKEAHDISVEIELKLREVFGNKTNILVHLEPFEEKHHDLDDFS